MPGSSVISLVGDGWIFFVGLSRRVLLQNVRTTGEAGQLKVGPQPEKIARPPELALVEVLHLSTGLSGHVRCVEMNEQGGARDSTETGSIIFTSIGSTLVLLSETDRTPIEA